MKNLVAAGALSLAMLVTPAIAAQPLITCGWSLDETTKTSTAPFVVIDEKADVDAFIKGLRSVGQYVPEVEVTRILVARIDGALYYGIEIAGLGMCQPTRVPEVTAKPKSGSAA